MAGLSVDVKITDTDLFKKILKVIVEIAKENPELNIEDKIIEATEKYNINFKPFKNY